MIFHKTLVREFANAAVATFFVLLGITLTMQLVKLLGQAQIATRRPAEAAATFERGVRLAPEDVEVRRFAMGAWQLAGNERRMRELYADGVKAGLPAEAMAGVSMGAR